MWVIFSYTMQRWLNRLSVSGRSLLWQSMCANQTHDWVGKFWSHALLLIITTVWSLERCQEAWHTVLVNVNHHALNRDDNSYFTTRVHIFTLLANDVIPQVFKKLRFAAHAHCEQFWTIWNNTVEPGSAVTVLNFAVKLCWTLLLIVATKHCSILFASILQKSCRTVVMGTTEYFNKIQRNSKSAVRFVRTNDD